MIIVPVSTGKDSTLCLMDALATGEEVIPVFCYTGWDHPLVYEYIKYLEDTLNIKVIIIKNEKYPDMESLITSYKRFPGGPVRFCTKEFKMINFKNWLRDEGIINLPNVEVWYGMRVAESSNRKTNYSWLKQTDRISLTELLNYPKYCKNIMAVLPILHLSSRVVFNKLKKYAIKRNELYNRGHSRVGCYPCFLSSKEDQDKCFSTDFGKDQLIRINNMSIEIDVPFTYGQKITCMFCEI